MSRALLPLLTLSLACAGAPDPVVPQPAPVAPAVMDPAPDQGAVQPAAEAAPPRPTVSVPSGPALSSFTGQGTHLGSGLWCAFYPLGWSDDGRFAWATERRGNDMALEYGALWQVLHLGSDAEAKFVAYGAEDFPEDATLAWAWSQHSATVEALLTEQTILAGGTELLSLPASTPAGQLEARWELGEVQEYDQRPIRLLIRWDGGPEAAIYEGVRSTLVGDPDPPRLILSPSGQHAVVVYTVVRGEPVEALVDVEYHLHGLVLG